MSIIAKNKDITTKFYPNDKNSSLAYTFKKEIASNFGVDSADLTIDQHLTAIAKIKSKKKADFLYSKVLKPLLNTKNSEDLPLIKVAEQAFKRDAAFFYNKMQTVYDLVKHYEFEQSFITVTSLKTKREAKNLDELAKKNLAIKHDFNELFRALFKQRIFKKTLNSSNRFYLRSNEFTKNKYLHTHFLMMCDSQNLLKFTLTFIKTFINNAQRLDIGRTEIVLPFDKYNELKLSPFVKEVSSKKDGKILVLNEKALNDEELKMLKRENYFYIKSLKKKKKTKNQKKDDSVIKYALKYVYKDFKDKLNNTNKNGICNVSKSDALYSICAIRRINFSRFTFAKYLYFGLKNEKGENLYDKIPLKELSILHIEKKIEVVLKRNIDFKTAKEIAKNGITENREMFNLDIFINLCPYIQDYGTSQQKYEDVEKTENREIKKYIKMLEKCHDYEELSEFLSDEFGIEDEFKSENIKYTMISEDVTLSNKFLKYIVINDERYYLNYNLKYILLDYADTEE